MIRSSYWTSLTMLAAVLAALAVLALRVQGRATAEEPPQPLPLAICHPTGPADAPNIELLTNLGADAVRKHLDHGDVAVEIVVVYEQPGVPTVLYACRFEPPPDSERHAVWEAYVDNGIEGGGLLNTACHFTGTMVNIGEFGDVPVPKFINGPAAEVHTAHGDRRVEVPDAITLVCQ